MNFIFETSKVSDGNMSPKWGEENEVKNNRKVWLDKFGIKLEDCVTASLDSGVNVLQIYSSQKGTMVSGMDAMVTTEKNLPLFMCVADCFPVVVIDDKREIIGLVHLGYRGIMNGLFLNVIKKFEELGSSVTDIKVKIGPGIKKESYVFDNDKVIQRSFDQNEWGAFLIDMGNGKTGVDLLGFLLKQINNLGIKNIEVSEIDTIKDTNYFSHYRSVISGEVEGRFGVVAMMK